MDLVQGSITVIEYATKFIQLLRFVVYLISDEEKKAEKFKRGLSPRVKTMMTSFNIRNFSQLVDLAELRKRTSLQGVSSGGTGPSKRVAMGGQPFQQSLQGRAPDVHQNQPWQPQRSQAPKLCRKCNKVH
jgi:hypothetical protein